MIGYNTIVKAAILFCSLSFSHTSLSQKKAIMLLIDGVPADVIERVKTPHLDEIAEAGAYTRAYQGGMKGGFSETPTISAPGYMNMITGVWAHKHNVWGNSVKDPNYNYWNIFRVVEEIEPEKTTAIFSTWQDNRTKLIGEGRAEAGGIRLDYSFDGFELNTIRFPHKIDRKFIFDIDELVSKEAARFIEQEAPDLSWVYLEFTDDVGHMYGDGPEMDEAVKKADIQIGRIWESVKKRERMGEDWMMVVTTDHGRSPRWNGRNHGGQTDRERTTWICTNQENVNKSFVQNPGVVDIMPSILSHLEIDPPEQLLNEIDGISFVGNVSFNQLQAHHVDGFLEVKWNPLEAHGDLAIWISKTNFFKEGKEDEYELVSSVPVSLGRAKIPMKMSVDFCKILVTAPKNRSNIWLVR